MYYCNYYYYIIIIIVVVQVISWNKNVGYLLASGSDDGSFKVWDLRTIGNFIISILFLFIFCCDFVVIVIVVAVVVVVIFFVSSP